MPTPRRYRDLLDGLTQEPIGLAQVTLFTQDGGQVVQRAAQRDVPGRGEVGRNATRRTPIRGYVDGPRRENTDEPGFAGSMTRPRHYLHGDY